MQHLLTAWEKELNKKLNKKSANNYFCLFLDFDGTLTKITKTPQQAVLSKKAKGILHVLAKNPNCQTVIVSGRTLGNIKHLVGIKEVIYAGNHGLEFGNWHTDFEIPISSHYNKILKKIKNKLTAKLAAIKGILIEDKKFSLCLHYRLVSAKNIPFVKKIFNAAVKEFIKQEEIKVMEGKKILEITPPIAWHKGKIVSLILSLLRIILKQHNIIPIYVGDDTTDENAFYALNQEGGQGIAVFVGTPPKATHAGYYLKDTREVVMFLEKLNSFLLQKKDGLTNKF